MNLALGAAAVPLWHGTYLDNCAVGGGSKQVAWRDTKVAIALLLIAGLLLNVKKLSLLKRVLPLLGMVCAYERY